MDIKNGDIKSSGEATFVCFIESAVWSIQGREKYQVSIAILCNNNENSEKN